MLPPGFIVAAPRSGSGKTTVTLGLLRALSQRGVAVQPFKCGPDYIDPAFHQAACGRPSFNVDSWAMQKATVAHLLKTGCANASLAIAEGLMGLFDGVASHGAWGNGASADLAVLTSWPVVLVLDISGQSQTAAAVARGFISYREGVEIAGVVLNRAGSERHLRLVRQSMESAGITVLGAIPRKTGIGMPERHLGLVQAEELDNLEAVLDSLGELISFHVDVDRVVASARKGRLPDGSASRVTPPGQRIALAKDEAFSFVYPHVVAAWRAAGAEIVPFSPLADQSPDQSCDVTWLPGGYPELHAGRLAGNHVFKAGLRAFAAEKPLHGECGGYMVLGQGLEDADGMRHEMAGLVGLETSFAKRRMHLGYRQAKLEHDCALGPKGTTVAGHEFHYATVISSDDDKLASVTDADGNPISDGGSRRGHVTGSFFHMIDRI